MASNTKAATIGALAGAPLAMLANRFLLGNTSGMSHAIAATLGGAVGAGTGLGIKHYLDSRDQAEQTQKFYAKQQAETEAQLQKYRDIRTTAAAIDDEADRVAYLNKELPIVVKPEYIAGTAKEINADVKTDFAQDRFANDPVGFGIDAPVDVILPISEATEKVTEAGFKNNEEFFNKLKTQSKRFAAPVSMRGGKPVRRAEYDEIMWGGLNTPDKASRFVEIQAQTGLPRAQLAAIMNYHQKLVAVAGSDLVDKNTAAYHLTQDQKNKMIDYMAIQAMPESQRRWVPLQHRLTSIQRANISNGWSYELDRDYIIEPEYFKKVSTALAGSEVLRDTAFLAVGGPVGAAAKGAAATLIPAAATVTGFAGPSLQLTGRILRNPWVPEDQNSVSSMLPRYYAKNILNDLQKVPQYAWMVPSIRSDARFADKMRGALAPFFLLQGAAGWKAAGSAAGRILPALQIGGAASEGYRGYKALTQNPESGIRPENQWTLIYGGETPQTNLRLRDRDFGNIFDLYNRLERNKR